jgi:very-short-patch-repair endonuclease
LSLNNKKKLVEIAKTICRELRTNSTEAEGILWEALRNKKLGEKKFYRQYPIYHDITGRETFFVADFYCHERKLIIELDGKYHQHKLKADKERTIILNYLGLKVIRFRNEEVVIDLKGVINKIKRELGVES